MRHHDTLTDAREGTRLTGNELGGVAVFFDTENILLGVDGEFEVGRVVQFLSERGEVMILRAYADWGRYRREQRQFLEEGVQMVFLASYGASDKNRTDTAICVDAMEILFTRPHIDTFVIVSGDSDFGVLARRLRDHGKRVVGVSAKKAASQILVKQCHEFAFYETLVGQRVQGYSVEEGERRVAEALPKIVDEHGAQFHASVLKDRMRKQDAAFSERNYGASSFTKFLANYEHLVTVLEGGLLRVPRPDEADEEEEPHRSKRSRRSNRPRMTLEQESEARAILSQAIVTAAGQQSPVPLSRLKDTMQLVASDFDELALGFKTFTRFLLAFPEAVIVDRANNVARPAPELSLSGPPSRRGPQDERRRPRAPNKRSVQPTLPAPGLEAAAEAPGGAVDTSEREGGADASKAKRRGNR